MSILDYLKKSLNNELITKRTELNLSQEKMADA